MNKNSEKTPACKDGQGRVNDTLTELVCAFDTLGFRVLKAETNGTEFELRIRKERVSDE